MDEFFLWFLSLLVVLVLIGLVVGVIGSIKADNRWADHCKVAGGHVVSDHGNGRGYCVAPDGRFIDVP